MHNIEVPAAASIRVAQGNLSQDTKEFLADWYAETSNPEVFGQSFVDEMNVVELRIHDNADDNRIKEARMVSEIDVTKGESLILSRMPGHSPFPQTCAGTRAAYIALVRHCL